MSTTAVSVKYIPDSDKHNRSVEVIFLDPSDPRIPYYTDYDGNTMYQKEHKGWQTSNVTVISKADTKEAKRSGKKILKPFESPDSTNDFFDEFSIQQKPWTWDPGFYNDAGLSKAKSDFEKADFLRAIYSDWFVEEQANPKWYEEIPISGILVIAQGFEENKATTLKKIKDRPLSDGTTLKSVATEYYDLQISARTAWWSKYDKLLKDKGSDLAIKSANAAQQAILDKFIIDMRKSSGGYKRQNKQLLKKTRKSSKGSKGSQ